MDQVQQIRDKIDIVSLISEYLHLKKMGRNFKTPCPFHNEKTPSFVVSPERQIWHCFGCQKGGDAYTFLMEYENLEFVEALRILAKKAGIQIEEYSGIKSEASSKKEKIYNLNHKALDFYHYILTSHNAGKKALDYLLKRGIKEQTINTFKLGFAPSSGRTLSDYLLNKKGYKKEDILDAGLSTYRNTRIFDFFINRIIFPLSDHRDNIIGFSGRILDANSAYGASKYVNTRETLVYHKGEVFFGLNIAKEKIKRENQAIILEGELDVISCFQEGITNVVAVKGTALTESQVNLISRFTQKVSLCFDTDSAGQDAIKRSLSVLEKKGITTTVIAIQNGKDPDEAIKNDAFVFKKAVKNDIDIYDFLISKALSVFDNKTAIGKKKIGDEILPFIYRIENEIVREHYLKKISKELDTTYESITKQVEKLNKKDAGNKVSLSPQNKKTRKEILEEYLLSLIVQYENPKLVLEKVAKILSDFMLDVLSYQKILSNLFLFFKENDNFEGNKFLHMLPAELLSSFDTCFLYPLPKFTDNEKYREEVIKIAQEIKILYLKNKIKEISEQIKNKEKKEELEDLEKLQEEFDRTTSLLNQKTEV